MEQRSSSYIHMEDEEDYTTSLNCESLFLFIYCTLFDCAVVVIIRVIPQENIKEIVLIQLWHRQTGCLSPCDMYPGVMCAKGSGGGHGPS